MPMEITVNGESRPAPEGQTLLGLIDALGLDAARVAVEFDLKIVKRERWANTALHPGARIEIVQFVGGG
ncbi:MAG TPA: sulfur carrier protein ThiS [Bryobacteraceae bacterium]|nr:sulfur carrier protein ThiS [Bryobacteraceae bacterium]